MSARTRVPWVLLALMSGCSEQTAQPSPNTGGGGAGAAVGAGGLGAAAATAIAGGMGDGGSIATEGVADPEHYWLRKVGTGPQQTARVCARGAADPVARALCAEPRPRIDGLQALYAALAIPGGEDGHFHAAVAVASSGLSARQTSVFHPRVVRMTLTESTPADVPVAATAFSRGDLLVELAGYDPVQDDINFYLLAYELECGAQCATPTLLSKAVEQGWQSWTLYGEMDLSDTPLDCLACHQSAGAAGKKHFLMRDISSPWIHWMEEGSAICENGDLPLELPPLRSQVLALYPDGYGGVGPEVLQTVAGHNLQAMIVIFGIEYRNGVVTEPFPMDSQAVYAEWRCEQATGAWQAHRQGLLFQRGFPTPTYRLDVTDHRGVDTNPEALRAFLEGAGDADVFEVSNGFVLEEAEKDSGTLAPAEWDAAAILTAMCSRCHDDRAPAGSGRERFRVGRIGATEANAALMRLQLPSRSPYKMPPRTAGELSAEARATLETYLRQLTQ